jgi:hypothetical protein
MQKETGRIMNRKHKVYACIIALAICAALAATVWGQGRGQGGNAPLQPLKQALTKVGAAALDSTQEAALQTAITSFRNANRPAAPDADEKAARDNYNSAILAGDNGSAKTAADQLANLMAPRQQARLEAEAAFSIQVLGILHSDQVTALQNSLGKQGLLRLVTGLAGPGGGFGRGMMGAGPMNARPMGNRRQGA